MKHGGKLWSCSTCINKNNLLIGYAKKEDFLANHKNCNLFMGDILSDPEKKRWGCCQDSRMSQGPFGCPKGHVWTGKMKTQKEAKKKAPVILDVR